MTDQKKQKPLEGGCLCRSVRYRIESPPRRATHCHCLNCRRSSGAAFVTWAVVERSAFQVVSGAPSSYEARAGVIRQFCARCGTQLTYQHPSEPDEIDVTAGSLDGADILKPEDHLWSERMLPWVKMADGLPRYKHGRNDK